MTPPTSVEQAPASLERGMGLLQATSTNIISMVGVGPFLTIPFMVAAINGPHIIYAWAAGLVLALADGLALQHLANPRAVPRDLYPTVLPMVVQALEEPAAR